MKMTDFQSKTPTFREQSPTSVINIVVPRLVVFPNQSEVFQSGTCCRIAKNLYVTAAHVVIDWMKRFGKPSLEQDLEIWAVHVGAGPKHAVWVVDRIWTSTHSDLAVLHTRPLNDVAAEDKDTGSAMMDLFPPGVGERVVGFGHHDPSQSVTIDAAGVRHIVLNAKGSATVGEVKEIHETMRDSSRLRFPCFHVNARFDGGMSGGPIFNNEGHLCGVICSNLPPVDNEDEHVSYAATLWPIMGIMIDVEPSGADSEVSYPLIGLAEKQIIRANGHERVRVISDGRTRKSSVQLRKITPNNAINSDA